MVTDKLIDAVTFGCSDETHRANVFLFLRLNFCIREKSQLFDLFL